MFGILVMSLSATCELLRAAAFETMALLYEVLATATFFGDVQVRAPFFFDAYGTDSYSSWSVEECDSGRQRAGSIPHLRVRQSSSPHSSSS